MPVGQMPVDLMPVGQMPVGQMPVGQSLSTQFLISDVRITASAEDSGAASSTISAGDPLPDDARYRARKPGGNSGWYCVPQKEMPSRSKAKA